MTLTGKKLTIRSALILAHVSHRRAGDGTFKSPWYFYLSSGSSPKGLALGSTNGVITANYGSSTVGFLGNTYSGATSSSSTSKSSAPADASSEYQYSFTFDTPGDYFVTEANGVLTLTVSL